MPELDPGELFQFDKPATGSPRVSAEVRDNFTALAQTNYTENGDNPATPRIGMLRIFRDLTSANIKFQWYDGSEWRSMLQMIEGGIPAPVKIIVDVTVADTVWTVDHNLGSKPIVQVFDEDWNQRAVVPPGAVGVDEYLLTHVNENRFTVTHDSDRTGHLIVLG